MAAGDGARDIRLQCSTRREKMQTDHWGRSVEHYSRLALITSLS